MLDNETGQVQVANRIIIHMITITMVTVTMKTNNMVNITMVTNGMTTNTFLLIGTLPFSLVSLSIPLQLESRGFILTFTFTCSPPAQVRTITQHTLVNAESITYDILCTIAGTTNLGSVRNLTLRVRWERPLTKLVVESMCRTLVHQTVVM